MITSQSRYVDTVLQTIIGPDAGTRQEMRIPFPRAKVVTYTNYRVRYGDRPDILSLQAFGNPELWWRIAEANPEYVSWLDIPVGAVVRIPSG